MPEVPDILRPGLSILFIGFNPGMRSAETGHHFAGYSNRFWKLLFAAGLTPRQLRPEEDASLPEFGCGITNIVARPTRAAAEIAKDEYRQGRESLKAKLALYQPRIAAYAGIGVYQEFAGRRGVACGRQAGSVVPGVADFVLPSPSGLNRMRFDDQLPYYLSLRQLAEGTAKP
ncbi:MAG TPA: G/U mismatch-specific DNA glycosylase [Selenomonadales bacterium]|nr:G/U mismatch-specific DNA glycosylase [Selenomonadales bacterium]